jgi:Ca-activated chloride channel homolog
MKWIFLFAFSIVAAKVFPQTDRHLIRKGNENYKNGSFQQAEVEYRKALEKNPQNYRANYNLGNTLYREKQYDAASAKFAGLADKEKDKQKRSRYYYNLGNSLFQNKKYKESVDAFKNALKNNPRDQDAKHNLQLAMKMLREQQNQQNKNQQNKNDKDNKNNKNDKNKGDQDKQKDQQNKDKQKDQQGNNQQQQNQQNAAEQPQKGQISPQDAERILQALENEEKEVMKKAQDQKQKVRKVQLEKNW